MKTKDIIKNASELAAPFRISKGKNFRLKDVDPEDTLDFTKDADKSRSKEVLAAGVTALAELQDKLYAQDKWAVPSRRESCSRRTCRAWRKPLGDSARRR